jgi:hypothetical protein
LSSTPTCAEEDATPASRMTEQQTTVRADMRRPPKRRVISSSAGRAGRVEGICRMRRSG